MVGTSTSRLTLYKPDPNDNVNVSTDLNANMDKIDLLGRKAEPITNPFVKRNNPDNTTNSVADILLETLTVALKTNHWYELIWSGQYNTSGAVGSTPNGTCRVRFKAGGSVGTADTILVEGNLASNNQTSQRANLITTFDVPADGSYTFGFCYQSGNPSTLNILASGGTDNTGIHRCMFIKDLGEK